MAANILLVDDSKEIIEILEILLVNEGYQVHTADNGKKALEILQNHETIDVVILDIMMPEVDGLEVLKTMRARKQMTPVILLSAKSAPDDKVTGLLIGADDYITKPFNNTEVIARVKSILRRQNSYTVLPQDEKIEIGSLIINKKAHEVKTVNGQSLQLTSSEFGILYLLASHPNRVFSANDIFEQVWDQDGSMSVKTVMVHISHLRDKIEKATGGEKLIKTVWGVGYKIES